MYNNVHLANIYGQTHTAGEIVSNKRILYSIVHNYIKVYDIGRKLSKCLKYEGMHNLRDIKISGDGRYIVTIDSNGYLEICSTETDTLVMHHPFGGRWEQCAIDKSGEYIAVSYAGTVNLYYIDPDAIIKGSEQEPVLLKTFSGLRDIVKLEFSPGTEFLAIVSTGGLITIKIIGFSTALRELRKEGFIENNRVETNRSLFSEMLNSADKADINEAKALKFNRKVPYLKELQEMFPQQEFIIETNDVVNVYFINPMVELEDEETTKEDTNIAESEEFHVKSHENQRKTDFCNVFNPEIVKNLLTYSLSQEDVEEINKEVDSGTLGGYSILILTSNGFVQVYAPGYVENEIIEQDTGFSGFFWHLEVQTKAQLSQVEDEDYDEAPLRLTAADYNSEVQELCVGTADGSYVLYSMPQLEFMHSASVSGYPLTSVSVLSSHEVATASIYERSIQIFDHRVEAFEIVEPSYTILSIAVSPDGSLLACGCSNGEILVYNTISSMLELRFEAHSGPVRDLQFLATSRGIASCSVDGVSLYDLNKKILFKKLQTETNKFVKVAVEVGGEVLATADENYEVLLFDIRTGKLVGSVGRHEGPITALLFVRPGILASGSWDRTVELYNVFLGSAPVSIPQTTEVTNLAVDGATGHLCAATVDGGINFYDLDDDKDVETQVAYHSVHKFEENNKIFKSKQHSTFNALSCMNNIIVGGGNGKFISVITANADGGELEQNIQISINYDFAGIDIDEVWGTEKEAGKRRLVNNYDAILLKQTRDADLRTRKVLDPILALENKKLEAKVIQICVSQVSNVIYALTTFGVLEFSAESYANTSVLSAKIDFEMLQKKLSNAEHRLTYDDLMDACVVGDKRLLKMAFNLFKPNEIDFTDIHSEIMFLKAINTEFPNNEAIFDQVIKISRTLAKEVGARTKREFSYTEMTLYIELIRFETLYSQYLRNSGHDLFKELECGIEALELFEAPVINLNEVEEEIIEKKLDKHNEYYDKEVGTGGLPEHKRRKGRIAIDKALEDMKQLE